MAVTRQNMNSFLSILTDSTTENVYRINSLVNDKRVYGVTIGITVGESDTSSNYTEAQKAAVHDAIVTAVNNKIGSGM